MKRKEIEEGHFEESKAKMSRSNENGKIDKQKKYDRQLRLILNLIIIMFREKMLKIIKLCSAKSIVGKLMSCTLLAN